MARSCEHGETECTPCFKERVLSIGLGSGCTPTRDNTDWAARRKRKPDNHWERQIPTDDRGMPYLDTDGKPVYRKKFAETRSRYRQFQKPVRDLSS